jgi:hypothetical protein
VKFRDLVRDQVADVRTSACLQLPALVLAQHQLYPPFVPPESAAAGAPSTALVPIRPGAAASKLPPLPARTQQAASRTPAVAAAAPASSRLPARPSSASQIVTPVRSTLKRSNEMNFHPQAAVHRPTAATVAPQQVRREPSHSSRSSASSGRHGGGGGPNLFQRQLHHLDGQPRLSVPSRLLSRLKDGEIELTETDFEEAEDVQLQQLESSRGHRRVREEYEVEEELYPAMDEERMQYDEGPRAYERGREHSSSERHRESKRPRFTESAEAAAIRHRRAMEQTRGSKADLRYEPAGSTQRGGQTRLRMSAVELSPMRRAVFETRSPPPQRSSTFSSHRESSRRQIQAPIDRYVAPVDPYRAHSREHSHSRSRERRRRSRSRSPREQRRSRSRSPRHREDRSRQRDRSRSGSPRPSRHESRRHDVARSPSPRYSHRTYRREDDVEIEQDDGYDDEDVTHPPPSSSRHLPAFLHRPRDSTTDSRYPPRDSSSTPRMNRPSGYPAVRMPPRLSQRASITPSSFSRMPYASRPTTRR